MNIQYIQLNDEYEFAYYCAKKSIEAFDAAIEQKYYFSRFSLSVILATEIFLTPFYLANKLIEIAINIFHILNEQEEEENDLNMRKITNLASLVIIQVSIPLICTAIRICTTFSGLFFPSIAIRGWKFAESGECLYYLLWSNCFQNSNYQFHKKNVCEEIYPSNAIFYLGEMQTRLGLEERNYPHLENDIIANFSNLLKMIIIADSNCFYKLCDYNKGTNSKIGMKKEYEPSNYYRLSHDVKQILFKLKPLFDEKDPNKLIDSISEELSIEEIQKLFHHIYSNLSHAFIEDALKVNQVWVESQFTTLKDLFSRRFRFGRAHFYQSVNTFYCKASD